MDVKEDSVKFRTIQFRGIPYLREKSFVKYRKKMEPRCPHKSRILKCKECTGVFCVNCIQLEKHSCTKMQQRIQNEKDILKKNLVKVVATKIAPI